MESIMQECWTRRTEKGEPGWATNLRYLVVYPDLLPEHEIKSYDIPHLIRPVLCETEPSERGDVMVFDTEHSSFTVARPEDIFESKEAASSALYIRLQRLKERGYQEWCKAIKLFDDANDHYKWIEYDNR